MKIEADPYNDPLHPMPLTFRMWHTSTGHEFQGTAQAPAWVSVDLRYDSDEYELVIAGDVIPYMAEFWNRHATRDPYTGPVLTIEVWAPVRPDPASGTPRWLYGVFPHLRTAQLATFANPYGEKLDAFTFTSCSDGADWGAGPYPMRFALDGKGLRPASLEWNDARGLCATAITTMAPSTALQYTDHITHRKPARKAIS